MELEALFDAVIVKPFESEETTYGNIIVPDLGKEKNEFGEVVAVGPGKPTISGEFIPTVLKVGDKVVLNYLMMEKNIMLDLKTRY